MVKFYLVTEFGTLVALSYNLSEGKVTDIQISTYIKQMVCFKIRKLHTNGDNLDICMLIEHDCLCQIKIWNEGGGFAMPD